mgnify:CR=1 FL=1
MVRAFYIDQYVEFVFVSRNSYITSQIIAHDS